MDQTFKLSTTGRDGVQYPFAVTCHSESEYEGERTYTKHTYYVRTDPDDPSQSAVAESRGQIADPRDSFQFTVAEISTSAVKVIMMTNNGESAYSQKGIPEAMIEAVSSKLEREVQSSSNKVEHRSVQAEWRADPATKVWDRLVDAGKASYDAERDTYVYPAKTE